MKKNDTIKEDGANLTLEELESLAEEVRIVLTQNKGMTLDQYKERASTIDPEELGCRKLAAICKEPKLEAYFPDEVIEILRSRFFNIHKSNLKDDDIEFIHRNEQMGNVWLSKHMYIHRDSLSRLSKKHGLNIISKKQEYTQEEEAFISQNSSKGSRWLAEKLNRSMDAICNKARRMKIHLGAASPYTPEDDIFIKNNMLKGSRWIATQINRNIDSVRKRANKLNILLPVIVDGQECHKFSPKEDDFIRQNSDKNAVWIARQLHMPVRSIQRRANLIKIKLPKES
jgi:hypothetical protein